MVEGARRSVDDVIPAKGRESSGKSSSRVSIETKLLESDAVRTGLADARQHR